jgi:hypothetical protein
VRSTLLLALALVGLTLAAYAGSLANGFVWDDAVYLKNNVTLRSFEGLARIWLEPGATAYQYFPMVNTSFWVEYQLWQLEPAGYHAVNLALQIAISLLLWRALRLLRVPGSWLAAAVFAVHPVGVESVAWIAERKNLLSTFFYLCALLAFLRWVDPDTPTTPRLGERPGSYALSLLFFELALLSKALTCTLPGVLGLILWWKRGCLQRADAVALAPLVAMGVAFGAFSVWMETHVAGAAGSDWELSWSDRVLIAGRAFWFYAGKLVWPHPLIFQYPRWTIDASQWQQWLPPVAALALPVGLWRLRTRVGRAPLVAVLCYAGTLLPILGFIDFYFMRYSFVQDHFQYLASPFLIALVAAAAARVAETIRGPARSVGPALAAATLLVLTLLTARQTRQFESEEALWRTTLERNPGSWLAHYSLAEIAIDAQRYDEAVEHLRSALKSQPALAETHSQLGAVMAMMGRFEAAERHLRDAIEIDPGGSFNYWTLSGVLRQLGREDEANRFLKKALGGGGP